MTVASVVMLRLDRDHCADQEDIETGQPGEGWQPRAVQGQTTQTRTPGHHHGNWSPLQLKDTAGLQLNTDDSKVTAERHRLLRGMGHTTRSREALPA